MKEEQEEDQEEDQSFHSLINRSVLFDLMDNLWPVLQKLYNFGQPYKPHDFVKLTDASEADHSSWSFAA